METLRIFRGTGQGGAVETLMDGGGGILASEEDSAGSCFGGDNGWRQFDRRTRRGDLEILNVCTIWKSKKRSPMFSLDRERNISGH